MAWIVGIVVLVLVVGGAYSWIQNRADQVLRDTGDALSSIGTGTSSRPIRTPSPKREPAETPALAAFEPIALSGSGNAVPRFTIPASAIGIADLTHRGGSNFAVWTVGEDGSAQELLVNTIGNYGGTVLFDTQLHSVAFKVEADGAWTINVKPWTSAFHWNHDQAVTGTGDDVVILEPATSGLTTVTITHSGLSNFAVWAYSASTTDLLVNEIGNYTGESLLGSGTILLQISADGAWTIAPPR